MSTKNIKSGWKAAGLWPKYIAKPLLSPFLLENSNKAKEASLESLDKDFRLDWSVEISQVI